MKVTLCLVLLGLASLAASHPIDIIDFEVDKDNVEIEHEQEGQAGTAVEGEYSWLAPDGVEYFVKYIADNAGYRVIESNALPQAPVVPDDVDVAVVKAAAAEEEAAPAEEDAAVVEEEAPAEEEAAAEEEVVVEEEEEEGGEEEEEAAAEEEVVVEEEEEEGG